MRYTIAVEKQVKELAAEGRSLEYISTITGIAKKVIWQWVPELRPHDDVIKQSVKQRYHFLYPDLEAKISTAFSSLVRESVSEDQWDNACKVIYDTLFEESVYVFKNVLTDPPTFGEVKRLSDKKFVEYLREFWDFDNSPYIAERNSERQTINRKSVSENRDMIHNWYFLKNKLMRDVTKGDVEILHEKLAAKKLSSARIYRILKVGLIPLEYAYKNGLTLLRAYDYQMPKIVPKTLDSLTVSKIFNAEWTDKEAYLANILAYYGNLTIKETAAITLGDCFSDGTIVVGDKTVRVPGIVIEAVLKYASTSPYKDFSPTDYIFYTIDRYKHANGKNWTPELRKVASRFTDEQISFSIWR